MPTYATFTGLVTRFKENQVRQAFSFRGDSNLASPDETTAVDPVIARVEAKINGILEPAGFTVPFSPVPSQIQDIAEVWTLIEARRDGGGGLLSEAWQAVEDKLIARLVDIATGKEILEGLDAPTGSLVVTNTDDGRARVWTDFKRDENGNIIDPTQILPRLERIL